MSHSFGGWLLSLPGKNTSYYSGGPSLRGLQVALQIRRHLPGRHRRVAFGSVGVHPWEQNPPARSSGPTASTRLLTGIPLLLPRMRRFHGSRFSLRDHDGLLFRRPQRFPKQENYDIPSASVHLHHLGRQVCFPCVHPTMLSCYISKSACRLSVILSLASVLYSGSFHPGDALLASPVFWI